jgi:hypothetical protein
MEELRKALEALKPFAFAASFLHPSLPDDGLTLDGIEAGAWRRAYTAYEAIDKALALHADQGGGREEAAILGDCRAAIGEWIGFSASVIKSGEPWTETCEDRYQKARQGFARLPLPSALTQPPQAPDPALTEAVGRLEGEAAFAEQHKLDSVTVPFADLRLLLSTIKSPSEHE